MSISTTTLRSTYAGAGTTGPFAYTFKILSAGDLRVTKRSSVGTDTTLALNTDYTVSGVGNTSGTITLTSNLNSGETLSIRRDPALTQPVSLPNQGEYTAQTHETEFDRLVMQLQSLKDQIDRAPKIFESYDPASLSTLVKPIANQVLAFDPTGLGFESRAISEGSTTLPGGGRTVATLTDYLQHNAVANVLDYGAKGDGLTDDTAAFQAALNTGYTVLVPYSASGYATHGLTQNTNGQGIYSPTPVNLIKNANGDHFTSTGNNFRAYNICLRGNLSSGGFTGNGWVSSGADPVFHMCGSRWCPGRALKATGGEVRIWGTSDIYQTSDATATGYDIELGIAGTATLYHELHGIYTSQATGGILATDVGGTSIIGGQVGKIYFKAGTSPAGVGVNKVVGTRMNGAFTCEISNTVVAGGAFSSVSITFAVGTSGCAISPDTVLGTGHVLTNNGNASSPICQSFGNAGVQQYKYGDDTSTAIMSVTPNIGEFMFSQIRLPNNKNLYFSNAAGNASASISESVAGNVSITSPETGGVITIQTAGSASRTQIAVDGVVYGKVDNTGISPAPSANGAEWRQGSASELITLSTGGTTTDSVANLLPANSIIEAVVARVITTITVATSWAVGDPTTAARFSPANATMTAGTTSVGITYSDQTGAAGPKQTAAAKVRITTVGTPGAGSIRITVFYRTFVAPSS